MDEDLNAQTWLEEHGDYLYGYAFLKVKDKHLAEDMVQETFLAAIAAKNTFSGNSSVRTWLTSILKHKIIDNFRRQGRVSALSDLAGQSDEENLDHLFRNNGSWIEKPEPFPSPDSALQQKQFWKIFLHCLSGLKSGQAEIFLAREIHGMNNEEICKHFSITPSNAWVLMHRARLALIQCLKSLWIDSEKNKC
jgi:RNA polymerase sigma-70 factor, ECF subfamily